MNFLYFEKTNASVGISYVQFVLSEYIYTLNPFNLQSSPIMIIFPPLHHEFTVFKVYISPDIYFIPS